MLSRITSYASKRILVLNPLLARPSSSVSLRSSAHVSAERVTEESRHSLRRCENKLYSILYGQLRSPARLSDAKKLHNVLVVNGFFREGCDGKVLGSQLVNVYVRFGRLEEAAMVFDELPNKNNIAYNAIIRGLVNEERFSVAVDFFHRMILQEVVPDDYTYPLVLKACGALSDLAEGREVRDLIDHHAFKFGRRRSVHTDCALIDMFSKCGSLEEARQVFQGMASRDLASWNAMISGIIHEGEFYEAMALFKEMTLEGFNPDSTSVATVLPACGRLGIACAGKAFHGYVVKSGFGDDMYVCNALMDMYCKCWKAHDARDLFCRMIDKDAVSWSTIIVGFSQNGRYCESVELFFEMLNEGIATNPVVAASVLPALGKLQSLKQGKEMHSYVLRQGFESDVVITCSLIDMYMSCRLIRAAEGIFERTCPRDSMVWNTMIAGYSVNNDKDSAMSLFCEFWKFELRPNYITVLTILPLVTEEGNIRHGQEIHGYLIRSDLIKVVSVANSLIEMYSKCGFLEGSIEVFGRMISKDIVTYNTMISAHACHGLGKRALFFFEQMEASCIRPNKVTFISLLWACSHSGLLQKGWSIYNMMTEKYGIVPEIEHCACIVDLLGRSGDLTSAYEFVQKMPVEPDKNVLGSLLNACRVHKNFELAKGVERRILQRNSNEPGHHVLLHNVYASGQRWEDALMIRRIIKEKGLAKDPGSSWIQIGQSFHVFHAGGWTHPESSDVYKVLDDLFAEMTDRGYTPEQRSSCEDILEHTGIKQSTARTFALWYS